LYVSAQHTASQITRHTDVVYSRRPNAIQFLRANASAYGIDCTRVATFGNLAGGSISLVDAIEFDTLTGAVSDLPGVSSKLQGAVSTGATLVDGTSTADSLVHYDASDTPVLLPSPRRVALRRHGVRC
jgi:acetyl esterase/lipase